MGHGKYVAIVTGIDGNYLFSGTLEIWQFTITL